MAVVAFEAAGAEEWEGVAAAFLDAHAAPSTPQDAFALATAAGCETRPWRRSWALLLERVIWYPERARPTRQHWTVAHELGHLALHLAGEPDSEDGADYVGGALMLPRRAFERDLRETAWDLMELQARHRHCPASTIARRIAQVRNAVATVMDNGRVCERLGSPWMPAPDAVTAWEWALLGAALETGEEQRDGLATALPVFDGSRRRVVLVVDRERLDLPGLW